MRILFVDPICLDGHINFNRLHTQALLNTFEEVDFCFVEDYDDSIGIKDLNVVYTIPKKIINISNGLKYRLSLFRSLRLIKKNICLSKYDAIIISCYDEIALALSFFPHSYVINHNNLSNLNHLVKRLFFRYTTRLHSQIVLNDRAYTYLKSIGAKSVYKVNHGLIKPYISAKIKKSDNFVIFTPSLSSTDRESTNKIINDPLFLEWLEHNNAILLLRGDYTNIKSNRIKILSGKLSDEMYQELFVNADCLLINYSDTFNYRVSAVILEGIANNKVCVIKALPDFEEYKAFFGDKVFFTNIKELIQALTYAKENPKDIKTNLSDMFTPDYSFINSVHQK